MPGPVLWEQAGEGREKTESALEEKRRKNVRYSYLHGGTGWTGIKTTASRNAKQSAAAINHTTRSTAIYQVSLEGCDAGAPHVSARNAAPGVPSSTRQMYLTIYTINICSLAAQQVPSEPYGVIVL